MSLHRTLVMPMRYGIRLVPLPVHHPNRITLNLSARQRYAANQDPKNQMPCHLDTMGGSASLCDETDEPHGCSPTHISCALPRRQQRERHQTARMPPLHSCRAARAHAANHTLALTKRRGSLRRDHRWCGPHARSHTRLWGSPTRPERPSGGACRRKRAAARAPCRRRTQTP